MKILFIALMSLFCLALMPLKVHSNELTCPIKEVSLNEEYLWRVTDTSCPLGEGLWDKVPASKQGIFWIQCAFTRALPEVWFAKLLSNYTSLDNVIIREEPGQYRCLIGPFSSYDEAMTTQQSIKSSEHLNTAFVRQVREVAVSTDAATTSDVVDPVNTMEAVEDPADLGVDEMMPETTIPNKSMMDREFYQVGNLYSPMPLETDSQYMEGNKKWLRAPYSEAEEVCTRNGMKVVGLDNLKTTADNLEFKESLPKRLPFWVQDKIAFDVVMMVPISLTENSAIYVICE